MDKGQDKDVWIKYKEQKKKKIPWPFRVRFLVDKVALGHLSPSNSVLPRQCHSNNAPQSYPSQHYSYQREMQARPGNVQTQQCSFGRQRSIEQRSTCTLLMVKGFTKGTPQYQGSCK
jgi:hypothetical protein